MEQGFALTKPAITVLTERELYGERVRSERDRKRRRGTARDPEAIIRDLTELTLYVPVAQLGLVSRYSGTAPNWRRCIRWAAMPGNARAARPPSRCATSPPNCWPLRAARAARDGYSHRFDRRTVRGLRTSFGSRRRPISETAIDAVIQDLVAQADGSPDLRRRRLRQDRGRAARRVRRGARRQAGRVLVPTTLLAEQHYQNFADRFADWPVRVDVLSRFRTTKEVNER
jgi:transcription-repair coupling factor (superfamily II helicase)